MATNARLDELKKKFDENPRRYFAPLANEYRKQGDATQAIALCRTHLPNQPGHISGHIVLAQALYESRELAEASQVFEAALDLDPENLIALRYLGDISREQGAPAAARSWYRRVLEFDPRNEEISQLLADVGQEADAALAELASRPTPPSGSSVYTALDESEAPAMPDEAIEPPTLADEPIDLYDSDPTGDAWRETTAQRADGSGERDALTPPTSSDAELVEIGELAAVAETPLDDWFAPPSVRGSAEPEVRNAETDIAPEPVVATPESSVVDAPAAADAFSWSSVDTSDASSPDRDAAKPHAGDDALLDFTGWAAAPVESTEAKRTTDDVEDVTPVEWSPELPSLSDMLDEPAAPAPVSLSVPDDAAVARPTSADSASEDEAHIAAAFEDEATSELPIESVEPIVVDAVAEPPRSVWADAPVLEPAFEPNAAPAPDDDIAGIDIMEDAESAVGDVGDNPEPPSTSADDELVAAAGGNDPLIGRTPSFVPVVSDESSAPFVTETMAELYLQQGFNEEALSIYRQLLARNPEDVTLGDRVRALESGASSSVVPDEAAPVPASGSESARSFFSRFANRAPSDGPRAGDTSDAHASSGTVPMAGAALPDEALTRPDSPTLTHIFSGRDVPAVDAQAANTLASAFGTGSESSSGGELSLERLFRDVPARSAGAVTLGEPGTPSSSQPSESSHGPVAEGEAPADYEQFTAWLEGLKKK